MPATWTQFAHKLIKQQFGWDSCDAAGAVFGIKHGGSKYVPVICYDYHIHQAALTTTWHQVLNVAQ